MLHHLKASKFHLKLPCIGIKFFCRNLQKVEFSNDSKLQTIEEIAFSDTLIKGITIPLNVTRIGKKAFSYCKKFLELNLLKIQSFKKLVRKHSIKHQLKA